MARCVSRSWSHTWQRTAPPSAVRAARRETLVDEINAISGAGRQRHSAPCIYAELRGRGRPVSRKRVAKLMKANNLRPPGRKRRIPMTTDKRHGDAVAPNLLDRNFEIAAPDTVWRTDISHIPVHSD
ncbi:MAG: IS3 family transposase [Pseudomonadota bacterium]